MADERPKSGVALRLPPQSKTASPRTTSKFQNQVNRYGLAHSKTWRKCGRASGRQDARRYVILVSGVHRLVGKRNGEDAAVEKIIHMAGIACGGVAGDRLGDRPVNIAVTTAWDQRTETG